MASYRLSELADEQLFYIYLSRIEAFGRNHAQRYQDELDNSFDLIARNPMIGRSVGTSGQFRRHIHQPHAIFYEIDAQGVVILAIVNMLNVTALSRSATKNRSSAL